jgi:hypothetical protein
MRIRKADGTYGSVHERPSGYASVVIYALREPAHQNGSVVHGISTR